MSFQNEFKEFIKTIPLKELLSFHARLDEETDRGCALLAASHIEARLESLLQAVLVEDKNLLSGMLTGNRPLATLSAKADLAYLMGLISKPTHRDINLIRRIRNEFAHSIDPIDFTTSVIANRCSELQTDYWHESLPPRKKYIRVICGVLVLINAAIRKANRIQERPHIPDDEFGRHSQTDAVALMLEVMDEAEQPAVNGPSTDGVAPL